MLEQIIYCSFFAFCCALLTMLWYFCIGGSGPSSDRIFSRLGFWLLAKYEDFHARETERLNTLVMHMDDFERVEAQRRVNPWKVFACMVCFNVWVGIITGALLITLGGFFTWWFLLPYIVLSNFFVRLLMQRLDS